MLELGIALDCLRLSNLKSAEYTGNQSLVLDRIALSLMRDTHVIRGRLGSGLTDSVGLLILLKRAGCMDA